MGRNRSGGSCVLVNSEEMSYQRKRGLGAIGFTATVDGVSLPVSGPQFAPPTSGQGGVFAPALGVPVGGNLVVTITGGAIDRDVLLNRADGNGAILLNQQIVGQADDNGNFTYSAPALPGIVYESWWLGGEPVGSYGYNGGGSGTVQPTYTVADYAKATGQPALPQQVYNTPDFVSATPSTWVPKPPVFQNTDGTQVTVLPSPSITDDLSNIVSSVSSSVSSALPSSVTSTLSSIPTWAWIAGGAVAVLLIFGRGEG
jgi:hypothetical protein